MLAVKLAMLEIENASDDDQSISELLLADIHDIFQEKVVEKVHSQTLVESLLALDDRPWREWRKDRPLTMNSLSGLLKPYDIKSKQIKIDGQNRHGYREDQFSDAWSRYFVTKDNESA